MSEFLKIMEKRRSQYQITNASSVSDDVLKKAIEVAVMHTPTAFNMQSARVLVLLNEQHARLWDIALEELRKIVPAEAFAATQQKIDSFKAGYGSLLYFEDTSIADGLAEQFPLYKDNFPLWAQQANGMLQFAVWNVLTELKLGATLQHYNPLIDEEVAKQWNIPVTWKLVAQMPFGVAEGEVPEKAFAPIEDRVLFYR